MEIDSVNEQKQQIEAIDQVVVDKVQGRFPESVKEVIYRFGELTLVVDRASLTDVCVFMRDDLELTFRYLCDLSAVDMWPEQPRFEVNVHLLKVPQRPQPGQGARRVRLKVRLEERDPKMPTLSDVWQSSAWYERETAELFGIEFEEHPDLRRLLLPDDWENTPPMRRDVPVKVEEVAFTFNQERIYSQKPFVQE